MDLDINNHIEVLQDHEQNFKRFEQTSSFGRVQQDKFGHIVNISARIADFMLWRSRR